MMRGKCITRKENGQYIASCFIEGEKMKIIRSKDFDEIKDYCKENNLSLEILNKLKKNKGSSNFSL